MTQQFRKTPIKWENADFTYDNNTSPLGEPYKWEDVFLLQEIIAGGALEDPKTYFDKEPEKKKKFIKLLCKVNGELYEETKEVQERKITVKDIELVAKEVLGINVNVNL
tara:strand:- start:207 stop:533 length:327 start_codon:yes stop_codon:yes gene_type:complete